MRLYWFPHVCVFAPPSPILVRETHCILIYLLFVVVHQVDSGAFLVIGVCEQFGYALVHLRAQARLVRWLPLLHAEVPYLLGATSESVRR
jgi:hypothetical protein